jgi:hypothetical protein
MAIKISSTEVIDNSRVLQNITGANGTYTNFHAAATTITTVINFSTPVMTLTMSGNVTFSESNKGAGKTAILILDTSASGHTPTFSANVKWPGAGTAPTWSDSRYWEIAFVCWDSTTVRATAVGFDA